LLPQFRLNHFSSKNETALGVRGVIGLVGTL
jgi:hypothetical protein